LDDKTTDNAGLGTVDDGMGVKGVDWVVSCWYKDCPVKVGEDMVEGPLQQLPMVREEWLGRNP
jgi:hypothetical protein